MIDVDKLNRWQHSTNVHPYTCGYSRTDEYHLDGEGILLATKDGWECPYCEYRQPYRDLEERISGGEFDAYMELYNVLIPLE